MLDTEERELLVVLNTSRRKMLSECMPSVGCNVLFSMCLTEHEAILGALKGCWGVASRELTNNTRVWRHFGFSWLHHHLLGKVNSTVGDGFDKVRTPRQMVARSAKLKEQE